MYWKLATLVALLGYFAQYSIEATPVLTTIKPEPRQNNKQRVPTTSWPFLKDTIITTRQESDAPENETVIL